eukprot:SM010110S09549  [mRNA]  locus=s10110:183:414:- [translate_table: standard]
MSTGSAPRWHTAWPSGMVR